MRKPATNVVEDRVTHGVAVHMTIRRMSVCVTYIKSQRVSILYRFPFLHRLGSGHFTTLLFVLRGAPRPCGPEAVQAPHGKNSRYINM